ncbi:hypothetical protein IVB30_03865 [Bradyrhizobium sp. 200]|uniref:hypothetical protein n=1 Tax=Bradyrhizobium sp. 200 TaxID=2782665 RepID=UPI001FFEEA6E|nr:hypothetical protein [Bradyrhizobium sp. 200]UPJ54677.1 hypothetical protein IVB30_03865 [Bradyrhizobium sp. 200]
MLITRRQALCTSTFALGGAVLAPQLAKAETAAPKTAIAADPAKKLVTEQFMIDAADPGIKLYIRNKRTEDLKQFTSERCCSCMVRPNRRRRPLIFRSRDCPGWTTSPNMVGMCI